MRKAALFLLLHSFAAAALFAADVTVGVLPATLNSSDANFPTPQTDVSLENPATGTGTIDTVSFGWNQVCNGVAKIKFFRRSGNTLTMIDQRGPFDVSSISRAQTVAMSPPVNVQAGDLIAITRVQSCGNALAEAGTGTQGYVVLQGDATTGTISAGNTFHDKLGLVGTGTTTALGVAGYIPVVGSTPGSFGANFKTSMQIFNPVNAGGVSGKLIFRRFGTPGSPSDPSLTFNLGPGEIYATTDVLAAMAQAGTGSLDVVMTSGGQVPLILSRIYNDQGANGTAGVFEDLVTPATGVGARILNAGNHGYLIAPIEPARTRFNIGFRSLDSTATVVLSLENNAGQEISAITKNLSANTFEQQSFEFYFGISPSSSQRIRVTVTAGSAIVYGSTTDNVTNDPAIQFVTVLP